MIVGIIGGGASGMAAAISAARDLNVQVRLYERQARVGKKLMATGNGRCNLSNSNLDISHYHGDNTGFASYALQNFDSIKVCAWFRDLGLYTVEENSGRIYPYSDQANSVVDVLRLALNKENITVLTGNEIAKIRRKDEGFLINDTDFCDRIIIACGGLAGTKLGGTMSGYKLLNKLGHKSTQLRPSLVQLKCSWPAVVSLKGVRCECGMQILHNGDRYASANGELQFTDYGISGPVVFEMSRDVCREKGRWVAKIDFIQNLSAEELRRELLVRKNRNLPMDELFTGIIHNRLGRVLTKAAGVNGTTTGQLAQQEIECLVENVKAFEILLTEPMGMDHAQVTAGGVITDDFNPETMESKLVPGLYACGEVLDVDGDCGGYNLQWAWASGILAGLNAGMVK